jgi:hypothetical protein
MMLVSAFSTAVLLAFSLASVCVAQEDKPAAKPLGDVTFLAGMTSRLDADGSFQLRGQTFRLWGVRLPKGDCRLGDSARSSVGGTTMKCADLARAIADEINTKNEILWTKKGSGYLISTEMIELVRLGWLEVDPAVTREQAFVIFDAAESAKREQQGIWRLRRE